MAKQVLGLTEARYRAGRMVQRDLLRAQALHLEARIGLARERMRLKASER